MTTRHLKSGAMFFGSGVAAVYVAWLLFYPAPLADEFYVYKLGGACTVVAATFAAAWSILFRHSPDPGLRGVLFAGCSLMAVGALLVFWPFAAVREAREQLHDLEESVRSRGDSLPRLEPGTPGLHDMEHDGTVVGYQLASARHQLSMAMAAKLLLGPFVFAIGVICMVTGLIVCWMRPSVENAPPPPPEPSLAWAVLPPPLGVRDAEDVAEDEIEKALGITQCRACGTWVVPKADGACPACQTLIAIIAK